MTDNFKKLAVLEKLGLQRKTSMHAYGFDHRKTKRNEQKKASPAVLLWGYDGGTFSLSSAPRNAKAATPARVAAFWE